MCDVREPQWSPGGGRLLFYVPPIDRRSGRSTATILTLGGSGRTVRALSPQLRDEAAFLRWSPDGRGFAFALADGIYTAATDGRGARRILAVRGMQVLEWSARGRILFERVSGLGTFTVRSNGRDLRRLRLRGVTNPSFSPDGRRIVYDKLASVQSPYFEMRIARWDGRFDRAIRPRPRGLQPKWSADGKRIAYIADGAFSSYNQRVFTIRPDGSGRKLVYALPWEAGAVSIFGMDWQARPRPASRRAR